MDDARIGKDVPGVSGPEARLAFSSDGRTLNTVLGRVKSTRWDVTDPARCARLGADIRRDNAGPGQFRLTPDGRAVVSAARGEDTIRVRTIG